jgi:hypothetical protein
MSFILGHRDTLFFNSPTKLGVQFPTIGHIKNHNSILLFPFYFYKQNKIEIMLLILFQNLATPLFFLVQTIIFF